jgi:hypothetical protein
MFPRGAPGVALLLVRAGVAASTLVAPAILASFAPLPAVVTALGIVTAAIALGVVTPVAASACALFAIIDLVVHGASVFVIVRIIDAVALALLGPGGYSFDAWIFGRRVIVSSAHSKE